MEYLMGAVVMLITLNLINRYVGNRIVKYRSFKPTMSQSRSFETTRFFSITIPSMPAPLNTQAIKHFDSKHLRVVILDDRAYWIFEQTLYVADMIDGDIDRNSTKKVDTMALDKVELDKMILVVDQLTGGSSNDSGYPRNS